MSRLRVAYVVSGLTVSVIICVAALHLIAVNNCTGPSPNIRGVPYAWKINATIAVTAVFTDWIGKCHAEMPKTIAQINSIIGLLATMSRPEFQN
jgi:hypothetical protein